MTTFDIFHTTRVGIGVRDAPHIWGAGEIRDAGERRLFGGLARSEPFVTPLVWGTGEMSTEISAPYPGRWGNKHWKSRRIYVALGHDELMIYFRDCKSDHALCILVLTISQILEYDEIFVTYLSPSMCIVYITMVANACTCKKHVVIVRRYD